MLEILYSAVDENTKISMCGLCKGADSPDGFYSLKSDYSFRKSPVTEEELIAMYTDFYQYWVVWAKLIQKEIVKKHLFTSGRIYEDTAAVFKYMVNRYQRNITVYQFYHLRFIEIHTGNHNTVKATVLTMFQVRHIVASVINKCNIVTFLFHRPFKAVQNP